MNKKQLLEAFKTDLEAAKIQRANIDAKIRVWRAEYDGEPYGNEVQRKVCYCI